MRTQVLLTTTLVFGMWLFPSPPALAQARIVSDAECQSLRQGLAEHARLSDGVRRAVAAQAATAPAPWPTAGPAPAPPTGRAEAIRARLERVPTERQTLEDQRLGALVKFEVGRASQIQGQIQALDTEKATLEKELAALPAASTAPAPSGPQPATQDVGRIRCQDVPAALDTAVRIRQRELGAREGQPGVIPLIALKGQGNDQIAQELAAQFSPGSAVATQVGLLDVDGDGRLDGFVDVPVPGIFRLFRQRADGTIGVEVFALPGSGAPPAYGEVTRRLDETTARQTGQTLADLLALRPAGPLRSVTQTSEFGQAYGQLAAGNFADAGRINGAAARSAEFQNVRGENVRLIEILNPVAGGVALRRLFALAQPNDQEMWEETTTFVRPASQWRTDMEVVRSRETRTAAGVLVGTRSTSAPVRFTVER
jgi:hypothetical protein